MRHIEEEPRRLVVIGVEGEPSDRLTALLKSFRPTDCEGSLTETRTCLDHGYLLRLDLRDQVQQPGPVNQARCATRQQNLGSDELCFTGGDHDPRQPTAAGYPSYPRTNLPSAGSSCTPQSEIPKSPFGGMASSAPCAKIGRPIPSLTQLPPQDPAATVAAGCHCNRTAPQTAAVHKETMNMTPIDLIVFALSLVTTSLPLVVTYTLLLAR
jgi:hypothetical protein